MSLMDEDAELSRTLTRIRMACGTVAPVRSKSGSGDKVVDRLRTLAARARTQAQHYPRPSMEEMSEALEAAADEIAALRAVAAIRKM